MTRGQKILSWLIYFLTFGQLLFFSDTFAQLKSNIFLSLAAVIVFISLGVFIVRFQSKCLQSHLIEARARVEELFLNIGLQEENQQYAIKGATATVVKDIESVGDDGVPWVYQLTRFARNPDGEYFMLMFSVIDGKPSKPYVKHVNHTNARTILKEKYVPPKEPTGSASN